MSQNDSDFSELDLSFAGRVEDAAQRVQRALAEFGVVGLVEGQEYLQNSTTVSSILVGVEGKSVLSADLMGELKSLPLSEVVNERLFAALGPQSAYLDYECVYGTRSSVEDEEKPLQAWAIFAGQGLRAERLIMASVKDRGAKWRFWEENGCGLARYDGEERFHQFNFPPDSGTVIELIPSEKELSATIFAKGQRHDMDFSAGLVPITNFAAGSPAAERLEELLDTWTGFNPESFEQLVEMTGNARAVAELQRSQQNGAGIQGLLELLGNLGIGSNVVDYALNGNVPDSARSLEPRGTLDQVRLVRAEVQLRTGTKPSFFGVLKRLKDAR